MDKGLTSVDVSVHGDVMAVASRRGRVFRRGTAAWVTAVVSLLAAGAWPAVGPATPVGAAPPADVTAAGGTGRIAADPIAHDPTVIKQGRYYYSIITGDIGTRTYLPIRRSTDLLNW